MKTYLFWFTSLILCCAQGHLLAAPPANDDFANAINLGSDPTGTGTGTADEATIEVGEPQVRFDDFVGDPFGSTTWWKWTCPAGTERLVKVNTLGSKEGEENFETAEIITVPMDTIVMIFSGSDLATLTPLAESDDSLTDVTSEVTFVATPGTTYYIRVDAFDYYVFDTDIKLNLTSEGPPGNNADNQVRWGKARLTYTGDWSPITNAPGLPVFTSAALNAAGTHFQTALTLSKTHPEANLLNAIVSMMKLQKEPAFQTLLTQMGIGDKSADPELPNYFLTEDLDGKEIYAPGASTAQGIEYMKTVARPRLLAALAMFEKVTSTTYLSTLADSNRVTDSLYIDYGDVLLLRGGCKALLGLMDLVESYNMIAPMQSLSDLEFVGNLDGQHLADAFSGLLKFSGTDKRASLKTNLQAAITLYKQASTHILSKRPALRDSKHLIPLLENKSDEPERIANLDKVFKCLGGTTIVENGWSFNLGKLLTGTLSLRDLGPNFKANKVIKNSVPKSDLGGALPGATKSKVETFLFDEDALYEDYIQLGAQVAPGQELRGSINSSGGLFLPGTSLSLTATREPGYVFASWKFGDQTISTVSPYIFPVIREYTLMAHFTEDLGDNDKDGLSNYDEVRLGTNESSIDTDSDGWPDGLDASPLTADPRAYTVSQNFSGVSLNLPVGKILSVTPLPSGVTYDAVNERLIGRPNFLGATITTPKSFTVLATVKPTTGANFTLKLVFTVQPLAEKLYGTFNGLAERGSSVNVDFGGSLNVTVTNSGGVSGKLLMNGFTYAFPSNVRLDTLPGTTQTATCTLPPLQPTTKAPKIYIRFSIDSLTGDLDGTASLTATAEDASEIDLHAERLGWSAIHPTTALGTYNSLLTQSGQSGNLSYPQGEGYSILKVTNTGTCTWTGLLADGSAITGGTTLGSEGDVPFHLMLYANKGSIQGWTRVGSSRHTVAEPLTWKKTPTTALRSYRNGFPTTLNVNLDGSLYDPKTLLFTALDLASTGGNNTYIEFTQGNLSQAFSTTFRIESPNVITPPAVSAINNPNKIVLSSLVPTTGLFSGSFTLPETPARKADFRGLIVPHLNRGGGHFLLPQSSLLTSDILSGRVIIAED